MTVQDARDQAIHLISRLEDIKADAEQTIKSSQETVKALGEMISELTEYLDTL